jgi:hypothetical protein
MAWRAAIVVVLLGLWLAVGVAWGGGAALVFGFFLAIAAAVSIGAGLGGGMLTRSGGRYYEQRLGGKKRD